MSIPVLFVVVGHWGHSGHHQWGVDDVHSNKEEQTRQAQSNRDRAKSHHTVWSDTHEKIEIKDE